jgi:ATP-dependent DNA helicase RecG
LANTDGGLSGLGVEDDASVTGLPPEHQSLTGLAILIASRTGPAMGAEIIAIY